MSVTLSPSSASTHKLSNLKPFISPKLKGWQVLANVGNSKIPSDWSRKECWVFVCDPHGAKKIFDADDRGEVQN
ncbi:hypothetical protein L1987_29948 [Smallanthus sonchifolius]|uniref:Uncharacterized protein n=1 Tax=Smallanthus sonchifolius TaxID=185202 RepID=A0ACB9I254_9ASTR|nr:hypothetical protein L1987_29948 [Smallanthus sonchifolius]